MADVHISYVERWTVLAVRHMIICRLADLQGFGGEEITQVPFRRNPSEPCWNALTDPPSFAYYRW